MRDQGGNAADTGRQRSRVLAGVAAFLLASSCAGLVAAELLGAPFALQVGLSFVALGLALGLLLDVVARARRGPRGASASPEPPRFADPASLPWLTPVVRSVLDQVDAAVHVTDDDLIIRYVNPAFTRVSGHLREGALGRNAVDLMRSGAHDEEFYESLHQALREGRVWSGRIRNRRANGEHFEAEETISPIRGEGGQIRSYVSIQRDLSESEELERRMAQAKAVESFGLIAGGLAHDLKNFLAAIRTNVGFVQACVEDGSIGDADSRDALSESLEAMDKAGGLARKLLTLGRVHDRALTPIDPNAIIEGLEPTLQNALGRRIVMSTSLLPGGPRVLMDAVALEQIVINLVLNSRDAMSGGGTIIVEGDAVMRSLPAAAESGVEGMRDRLYYRLRVRDSGPGIPREIRDQVFEPFFTTKGDEGGTGLGLAVVQELVEQARGIVDLDCPEAGGTEISILLPALEMEDEGLLLEASLGDDQVPHEFRELR